MKLSLILRTNAAFTALCALCCFLGAEAIATRVAIPGELWVIGLGLALAGFVLILLVATAQPKVWLIRTIVALDWSYVVIASGFLLLNWEQADLAGKAMVIASNAVVSIFAVLQSRGLAHTGKAQRA